MTELFEPLPESAGTRRRENTRERLVRSSLDVFVDKGIDGATVDDLTRAAGFTRGAFYSNFSTKEEVFTALFASVTEELLGIAQLAVSDRFDLPTEGSGITACGAMQSEADTMVAVFEAIRPFGRQWYLLYSDAVARSLRDEGLRSELSAQRARMRDEIAKLLLVRMTAAGERPLLDPQDLAQLLVGIFIDLMLREQMDRRDVTDLAATTILGTLRAFVSPATPADDTSPTPVRDTPAPPENRGPARG